MIANCMSMTVAGGGVKLQVEVLITLPNLGKREVPLVSFGYFAAWSPDRVYNLGVRRKSSNDVVFRCCHFKAGLEDR